jgi:phosphoserine phosphatase RsbU/P
MTTELIDPAATYGKAARLADSSGVPLVEAPPALCTGAHPSGREWTPPRMDAVVVVDDDGSCRELMKHVLTRKGYEVITAGDGYELLRLLEQGIPRLILLDLEMPGLSGFDVCEKIKADPRWADIPIIFLTGTTDPEVKARAFEAGGADYITKPIERIELLARIKCHLELALTRSLFKRKASLYEALAAEQMGRLEEVRTGQTSMLTDPAGFMELKVAVRFVPAHEAGGDFYEIARLSDQQFGFLVTDVAGHDLSVPYVTGALKALAGLCLNENLTPNETMIMLNSGMQKILSAERYVTGCYAKFNREAMSVEIVNAGHPPALLHRHGCGCECINGIGDVLGFFEQVQFEPSHIEVAHGDRLFLYTDGLIEGYLDERGCRGRGLFGTRRLQAQLEKYGAQPIRSAVNAVIDQLIEESDGGVGDDVVLLGIEF